MFTCNLFRSRLLLLQTLAVPALMSTLSTPSKMPPYTTVPYTPRHSSFPYTSQDFRRMDESSDATFYSSSRFVTHIDDNAINLLREYYSHSLPQNGRILDFCSSWVSHFPKALEGRAIATARGEQNTGESLEVVGTGMNKAELDANPILKERVVQDLNVEPRLRESIGEGFDAATCVVSIDYLVKPIETLESVRERLRPGGAVHLVISNRCFPSKAVGRWLRISEKERLLMAGDYLWWAGFREVDVVTLTDGERGAGLFGGQRVDPLWVVRGRKVKEGK